MNKEKRERFARFVESDVFTPADEELEKIFLELIALGVNPITGEPLKVKEVL